MLHHCWWKVIMCYNKTLSSLVVYLRVSLCGIYRSWPYPRILVRAEKACLRQNTQTFSASPSVVKGENKLECVRPWKTFSAYINICEHGWKSFPPKNALAYLSSWLVTKKNNFTTLPPEFLTSCRQRRQRRCRSWRRPSSKSRRRSTLCLTSTTK